MNRAETFLWNLVVYLLLILMGEAVYWVWEGTGLLIYIGLVGIAICWPHHNLEENPDDDNQPDSD